MRKRQRFLNVKKCGLIFDDDSHPDSEKRKRLKRHEVLCTGRFEKEIFKCENVDIYLMMSLFLMVRKGRD